mgnify:CR=1 FL=1
MRPDGVPSDAHNLTVIERYAADASIIVMAHGVLHKRLQVYADSVLAKLEGIELYCLGRTKHGWPAIRSMLGATLNWSRSNAR